MFIPLMVGGNFYTFQNFCEGWPQSAQKVAILLLTQGWQYLKECNIIQDVYKRIFPARENSVPKINKRMIKISSDNRD